jgi:hypothetical protein
VQLALRAGELAFVGRREPLGRERLGGLSEPEEEPRVARVGRGELALDDVDLVEADALEAVELLDLFRRFGRGSVSSRRIGGGAGGRSGGFGARAGGGAVAVTGS